MIKILSAAKLVNSGKNLQPGLQLKSPAIIESTAYYSIIQSRLYEPHLHLVTYKVLLKVEKLLIDS